MDQGVEALVECSSLQDFLELLPLTTAHIKPGHLEALKAFSPSQLLEEKLTNKFQKIESQTL